METDNSMHHCEKCGTRFESHGSFCPQCGKFWVRPNLDRPRDVARALDTLAELNSRRLLAKGAYASVQRALEHFLGDKPADAPASGIAAATRGSSLTAPVVQRPPTPPKAQPPGSAQQQPPPSPLRPIAALAAGWAARRQADILLYLGAFLLSVAALIFVGFRGDAVDNSIRFAVVTLYTAIFIISGLLLHRWERVKEAGPVFLVLGAVLFPVDFFAFRSALGGGTMPADAAILIGSSACSALYFTLASRGFGKLYLIPSTLAGTVAWGALGSVINLPVEWFGAWYEGLAAAIWIGGSTLDGKTGSFIQRGAFSVSAIALNYSIAASLFEGTNSWALPTTLLIAVGGLSGALPLRRSNIGLILLPPTVAALVFTTLQAAAGIHWLWHAPITAVASAGYLYIADRDQPSLQSVWRAATFPVWVYALSVAHIGIIWADAPTLVLPATYAVAFVGAGAALLRWRGEWPGGLAVLPPLFSGLGASLTWVISGASLEWVLPWAALAAAPYLVWAELGGRSRDLWLAAATVIVAAVGITAVGIVAIPDVSRWPLPATLAISLAITSLGTACWRLRWRSGIASLPVLGGATPAALLWAWFDMPFAWIPVFAAATAAAYLVPAERDVGQRIRWRWAALTIGIAAITAAQSAAAAPDPVRAALPLTFGIAVLASLADSVRRRDEGMLISPAVLAAFGVSVLWSLHVDIEWWAVPPAAVGLSIVAAHRAWLRDPLLARWGWPYGVALAALPAVTFVVWHVEHSEAGIAASVIAAGALCIAALRSDGRIAALFAERSGRLERQSERALLTYAAIAFLFSATAHFNAILGIAGAERGWTFAVVGSIGWAAVLFGRRVVPTMIAFGPPAAAAFVIGATVAAESPAQTCLILLAATAWPAAAFFSSRHWGLWVISAMFAAAAARALWSWLELDLSTLPVAYAGTAALMWASLYVARFSGSLQTERGATIHALSWGPWLLAAASAAILLGDRSATLATGAALETTREWALVAVVLAGLSAAVLVEGVRLGLRTAWVPATAGLLLSILMLIAAEQPENVQAFTLPAGLYFAALGLSYRRSGPLFGRHMAGHETLIIAGVLLLVLPPAEQSFEPGGARFGFELIAFGLAFLGIGLLIHARWLIPSGVLTLSGVAIRWLTAGYVDVPYWLLLGALGTVLLSFGMVVLLARERWDKARERVADWWNQGLANTT